MNEIFRRTRNKSTRNRCALKKYEFSQSVWIHWTHETVSLRKKKTIHHDAVDAGVNQSGNFFENEDQSIFCKFQFENK